MQLPYYDFGSWLGEHLPFKVQKLPLDLGFTCPNRDGSVGRGGCIYCNNDAFVPSYAQSHIPLSRQIEQGKKFWGEKYGEMKYLAYLQAYSNTYSDIDTIRSKYEQVLANKDIVGIVIATRPDCISTNLLDYLEEVSRKKFLLVEYGIESTNDSTLKKINRMHDFACSKEAVFQTKARGILTGGHVILGLPGEDAEESLRQADDIASLQLDILKIHQLQIVKGTVLEKKYARHPFKLYTAEEYLKLVARYLEKMPPKMAVDRFVSQTPKRLLVAPNWNIKPQFFNKMLADYMKTNSMWQGKHHLMSSNGD